MGRNEESVLGAAQAKALSPSEKVVTPSRGGPHLAVGSRSTVVLPGGERSKEGSGHLGRGCAKTNGSIGASS